MPATPRAPNPIEQLAAVLCRCNFHHTHGVRPEVREPGDCRYWWTHLQSAETLYRAGVRLEAAK